MSDAVCLLSAAAWSTGASCGAPRRDNGRGPPAGASKCEFKLNLRCSARSANVTDASRVSCRSSSVARWHRPHGRSDAYAVRACLQCPRAWMHSRIIMNSAAGSRTSGTPSLGACACEVSVRCLTHSKTMQHCQGTGAVSFSACSSLRSVSAQWLRRAA